MSSLLLMNCNKYSNFFIKSHYDHIITGDLTINKLCQIKSKEPKYQEPKHIKFEEACKGIQTSIDQFTKRISIDKGMHKNFFLESEGNFFISK